jgi:Holliday junction resolvase RusA-like endonuclease
MNTINIKALSVNQCYRGRRFRTDKYKAYERELMYKLKPIKMPVGKLKVSIVFGFSSKLSDIDNGVKNFVDILQKRYKFNDRNIYEMTLKKVDVKKGEEFIEYEIQAL